jgi:uncharacterized protein with HEPN domain
MNADLRDKDYIDHILHAIDKINKYAGVSSKDGFFQNEMTQDAVIRNLEVIGEAVSKLSSSLKTQYNEIPWRQISGMRNRLIHGYMTTNLEIVWNTVEKVLPEFKKQIESIDLVSD